MLGSWVCQCLVEIANHSLQELYQVTPAAAIGREVAPQYLVLSLFLLLVILVDTQWDLVMVSF